MTTYIALLKGINVGGHNKIKMSDLKSTLEKIGLNRVETYIQSGNILFESAQEEASLQQEIEDAIEKTFGFSVAVILRSAKEINQLVTDCPFTEGEIQAAEEANTEGESMYVAFFSKFIPEDISVRLDSFQTEEDIYRAEGKNIYLLLRHSIRNSKLAIQVQRSDTSVTVRNWKTIKKLKELAELRNHEKL